MTDSETAMGRIAGIVVVQFLNAMIIVASPKVRAKLDGAALREHTLAQLAAFLETLDQMRPNRANAAYDDTMFYMEPHANELEGLAVTWAPGEDASPEIVRVARACLRAYNAPEPPGGWDQFEG